MHSTCISSTLSVDGREESQRHPAASTILFTVIEQFSQCAALNFFDIAHSVIRINSFEQAYTHLVKPIVVTAQDKNLEDVLNVERH